MKRYIIVTLFALFLTTYNTFAQQQTLEQQLVNLDLNLFLNKPVDTFFAYIPHTDSIFVSGTDPIYKGAAVVIEYHQTPFLWIYINIYDPQYITPYNHNFINTENAWPLSLVKKEKIERILIYKNADTLINKAIVQ